MIPSHWLGEVRYNGALYIYTWPSLKIAFVRQGLGIGCMSPIGMCIFHIGQRFRLQT